jgi:GNAT superfamily N-acetyltransferase
MAYGFGEWNNDMKSVQDVAHHLKTDALKYIVHLKMIEAYSEHLVWHVETVADLSGVLLLLPTPVNAFDAKTYPTSEWVVFLAAPSAELAERLVENVPTQSRLVFKLVDELSKMAVKRVFPEIERVTSYVSFTTDETFDADEFVQISDQLDDRLLPCYQENGYTAQEMRQYFEKGAMTFSLWGKEPLSTCFAFKNYEEIWEIGGVYTTPAYRQQGLGRRIVKTAISTLRDLGRTPRYVVLETNKASLRLAESLGLEQFATTEHYLYTPV